MSKIRPATEWEKQRFELKEEAVTLEIDFHDYYNLFELMITAVGTGELLPCHLLKLSDHDRDKFLSEIYSNLSVWLNKRGIVIKLPKDLSNEEEIEAAKAADKYMKMVEKEQKNANLGRV